MDMIATTISEHIFNEGKVEGRVEGKAEGRAEGKAEGKQETAINLLKMDMDGNLVCQATGLSQEELQRLAERLHITLSQ